MTEADLQLVFEQSGIKELIAAIAKLDANMAALVAEGNRAESEMRQLGNASDHASDQVGGLGGAVGGLSDLLSAAGLAVGAAEVLNLGKSAIESAINYETLSVQFEVFLGSASKAKTVLAELNKFSIETPFTPDEVNASGRALLAFGFTTEQLIPTLKMVGDVSAAVGKDFNELAVIYGKARTAGTLYAEDINQLTEAGIPIMDELAKVLGVQADQVKKLGSEGKISFATLEQAFANMTGEGGRFNGMMDKMSQSTAGLLSTIEGKLQDELRAIGQAMLPTVRIIAEGFEPAFKSLKEAFIEIFTPLGDMWAAFGDLFAAFGFGGKEGNKFANIVATIAKVLKVLTLPAQLIWKLVGALASAFTWAVKGIKDFVENSPFLLGAINTLTAPFRFLGDAIGWVGDQLGLTSNKAFEAQNGFNQFSLYTNEMRARLGATNEQLQAFIEQFDKTTLAGLSTSEAMVSVVRQFKAFLASSDESTKSANAFGKSLKDVSKEATFAAGSIAATEAQMKKLQDAFRLTGDEFTRTQLANKIADMGLVLERMKSGADLSILPPKAITDVADFAKAAENARIAIDSLGGGDNAFVESLTRQQQALVDFKVALSEVGATIKNDLGGALRQMGADLAENLGKAIGMGESLGDVFRKALADMLVTVPKLVGMALLNEAATVPSPASLPMAIAGLALLGLSGIIQGVQAKNAKQREEAVNMAGLGGTSAASGGGAGGRESGPMGLGESAGGTVNITLQIDGERLAQIQYNALKKEQRKRG